MLDMWQRPRRQMPTNQPSHGQPRKGGVVGIDPRENLQILGKAGVTKDIKTGQPL